MKKIIPVLIVSALAVSAMPFFDTTISDYKAVAESERLDSTASSLGADTDCFSFRNYTKNYLDTDIIVHECEDQSYGISMLQILSHNGVFNASDIQADAENLKDVQFNDNLEKLIESYQLTRFNEQQIYYKRKFTVNDVETLIQTANDAMENGKYFHISLSMPRELQFNGIRYTRPTHDITGIGITDGSWSFNGKSYDKCVLTLDSNCTGFDGNYCIYVNSDDNTFCIPAYQGNNSDDINITAVISDVAILNYLGELGEQTDPPAIPDDPVVTPPEITINPDFPEVDPDNSAEVMITGGKTPYTLEINGYIYNSDDINEYKCTNFPESDSYKINIDDEYAYSKHGHLEFHVDSDSIYSGIYSDYVKSMEISTHMLSVQLTYNGDDTTDFWLSPEKMLFSDIYKSVEINVRDTTDFTVTDREDGILLQSSEPYEATVRLRYDGDSDKILTINPVAKSLLINYDEDLQKVCAFIDRDGDNVYETSISDGDTDCNGIIDSSDASAVLEIYATLSTHSSYPMEFINIFSDADGDGTIDSNDASFILEKYIENSTS